MGAETSWAELENGGNLWWSNSKRVETSGNHSSSLMTAKIHSNGVRGFVAIYPGTGNQTSTIAVVVSGLKFNNTIDIRENMALKNVEKKCLDEDLGKR